MTGRAIAAVGVSLLLPSLLLLSGRDPEAEAGPLRVPPGFEIRQVAGPDLVSYAMLGTIDDRGRLFLCESSGMTVRTPEMAADPTYRIRLVEDLDGDGVYDRSKVFAEKLTLPAGAVWHRGSLYVAAPPDLLRFDDLDGDGIADRREVLVTGWNLSANAASLHGPILGPDGWLYLTDGRHGYKIRTKEGTLLEGRASRIWRVRPDGTGLEWVSGGGFDNPVEVVFTPSGEIIGTMTYFTDPKDGERDALLHFVEGGVYPKWHPTVSEFQLTGELMPVMTKFARIAPSGLLRYRGQAFGPDWHGNLFSAQFNTHRVQRHVLHRERATFRTDDEDFFVSSDPDFHPTDVIQDADGSLLVVDTGAWFIHGCPVSKISKPHIRGGIYRISRTGAKPVSRDPAPDPLQGLEDQRPFIHDQSLDALVQQGEPAVAGLSALRKDSPSVEARASAVFALGRIGGAAALEAVRAALHDPNVDVRVAAARVLGMAADRSALPRLAEMARTDELPARRQAATALGRIGDKTAIPALLEAAASAQDRFVEHAIIYSLIQLRDPQAVSPALRSGSATVRKAALIALDQMEGSPVRREHVLPLLDDPDEPLRRSALWVLSHHPEWSADTLRLLDARLRAPQLRDAAALGEALVAFCGNSGAQQLIGAALTDPSLKGRQLFLADVVERCALQTLPDSWIAGLGRLLDAGDPSVRLRALALIRTRGIAALDSSLERIAAGEREPDNLRLLALSALVDRKRRLEPPSFQYLLTRLDSRVDAMDRVSATQVLARASLSAADLLTVVHRLDPLTLPSLLETIRASKDTAIRDAARPLLERLREGEQARSARLQELEPLLQARGDVGRGRRIFFGDKAACYRCHTIGAQGGHVGPDLTAVGAVRSGYDILEAIVFPSASFVPGHEVYRVETGTDVYAGVRGAQTTDSVTLITGPNDEVRIPRSKIRKMEQSEVSLMPDGFDEVLNASELTDLLAFLGLQTSREAAQAVGR